VTGDFETRREALTAAWGQPRPVSDPAAACWLLGGAAAGLNGTDVLAQRYPSREAAMAFHRLGRDEFGHVSLGIKADPAGGVVGVMDVRARVAAMRAAMSNPKEGTR